MLKRFLLTLLSPCLLCGACAALAEDAVVAGERVWTVDVTLRRIGKQKYVPHALDAPDGLRGQRRGAVPRQKGRLDHRQGQEGPGRGLRAAPWRE